MLIWLAFFANCEMFGGGLIEGGLWIFFFFFWMVSPILMTNRGDITWLGVGGYRLTGDKLGFYVGDGLTVCRLW